MNVAGCGHRREIKRFSRPDDTTDPTPLVMVCIRPSGHDDAYPGQRDAPPGDDDQAWIRQSAPNELDIWYPIKPLCWYGRDGHVYAIPDVLEPPVVGVDREEFDRASTHGVLPVHRR